MIARADDPTLECTPEGDFETLQCVEAESLGILECRCVQPSDGTTIPGTQVTVISRTDAPDCDAAG